MTESTPPQKADAKLDGTTDGRFDEEVDVLVVGSGAGGLTTALTADARGLRVLVVEKADRFGGSSALSGGGIWVPGAPAQTREGYRPDPAGVVTYLEQIGKVIDVSKAEVVRNSDWFDRFDFGCMLRLLGQITMQRMLERDDFTKRLKEGRAISLHECLYPLMQGHDSVEIEADVELGGSEQLFNLMVGRDLQTDAGQEPQVCVTLPILRGLDGTRRMGKSLGNYVGVGEPAQAQFDKTMSIPDELLREWFTLLTDRPADEIDALLKTPFEAKKRLGKDIVQFYYGTGAAEAACSEWEKVHSQRQDVAESIDFQPVSVVEAFQAPDPLGPSDPLKICV